MATCPNGHYFRTPDGEEMDHDCPTCGANPSVPAKTCDSCCYFDIRFFICTVDDEWHKLNNPNAGTTEDCPLWEE